MHALSKYFIQSLSEELVFGDNPLKIKAIKFKKAKNKMKTVMTF